LVVAVPSADSASVPDEGFVVDEDVDDEDVGEGEVFGDGFGDVDESDEDEDEDESSDDADEPPDGTAYARPGVVATATPTPSVTANAPTRPMCLAYPMTVPSVHPRRMRRRSSTAGAIACRR